jgi:exodeoxyribonuclease V alpha subunit
LERAMSKLSEILKKHNLPQKTLPTPTPTVIASTSTSEVGELLSHHEESRVTLRSGQFSGIITYNSQQQAFIDLAASGKSCVLLGAAGTGKTTCTKGAIEALLQSGRIPVMHDTDDHKFLPAGGAGVVLCSFTRRAVRNLKRAVSSDISDNCITIHKLLEYQPEFYEVYDSESDSYKKTMRFEPKRNSYNPLPASIKTIIIDESSMVSLELFTQIYEALPYKGEVQFIFVGDIQQLPPVFGSAVLGFKMLELPVVELTEVYRQALDSPIIRLAHRILSGSPISSEEFPAWKVEGKLTLHPWKKKLHPDVALLTIAKFFTTAYDSGMYDPEEDMILCPFNKAFGTMEMNKHIANHIARKKGAVVWEVIAGFNKHYFSVGDKILFEKEDAEIVRICRNAGHTGKRAQKESTTLDYWGFDTNMQKSNEMDEFDLDSVDFMLAAAAAQEDERVTSASHIITLKMIDSEEEIELDSASEINALLLSYSLTVHKAQGSEWRKVFVTLHQSHNTMVQRELLYTAVTRAREELYVICEPDHFQKGILSQKIKGNTLQEKAEYFKGKYQVSEGA